MTKPFLPKPIILYVDDDPDDLMFLKEAFENNIQYIEVVTATNGIDALNYLNSLTGIDAKPCLIILDINMPLLNGKETLKAIRKIERFHKVPVILFTTSSLTHDHAFASKYKAGFITKPSDLRQMSKVADQFIKRCTDEIKKKSEST